LPREKNYAIIYRKFEKCFRNVTDIKKVSIKLLLERYIKV